MLLTQILQAKFLIELPISYYAMQKNFIDLSEFLS